MSYYMTDKYRKRVPSPVEFAAVAGATTPVVFPNGPFLMPVMIYSERFIPMLTQFANEMGDWERERGERITWAISEAYADPRYRGLGVAVGARFIALKQMANYIELADDCGYVVTCESDFCVSLVPCRNAMR